MSSPGSRPAVFLDRDGVLNEAEVRSGCTHPPAAPESLRLLGGVAEALTRLRASGFALVGASNQPDVARGWQRREVVEAINARLVRELGLAGILFCPHDDGDGCPCRKPRPGLLLEAARRFSIDLPRSWMVGDRWSDVAAGQAAGCRTVLIETPHSHAERCRPDARAADLAGAAEIIRQRLLLAR